MQQMTKTMNISRMVALAGSVLTLVQMYLLANDNDGICFNNGCEIVDSLTTIPPIFFNIGGFIFFQAIFWGVWLAKGRREWMKYINILLLAALAAEGVLVSFQYLIAQVFCTYCLIVLCLVLLLNVLAGWRHIFTGAAVFSAVIIGFASLQFTAPNSVVIDDLDRGAFALLAGEKPDQKNYLFFSSTCKYCEKVIESLNEENICSISFNPIDEITEFSLDRATRADSYSTDVNRKFLSSMGIEQIPVFLSVNESGTQIVKGEGPIKMYLQKACAAPEAAPSTNSSIGFSSSTNLDFLPPVGDDSCTVDSDCDDPYLVPKTN
jgi:hypothetical protein